METPGPLVTPVRQRSIILKLEPFMIVQCSWLQYFYKFYQTGTIILSMLLKAVVAAEVVSRQSATTWIASYKTTIIGFTDLTGSTEASTPST